MPLNINLPVDRLPNTPGHTIGHNLANEAINRTAAAVDALHDLGRTGRLSDAADLTTAGMAVGWVVAVAAIADGRPTFELIEQTGGAPVPDDATVFTKGVARLLGGTADAPTVPWASVTGKPSIPTAPGDIGAQPAGSYATSAALAAGLADKLDSSALPTALATKADTAHTHLVSDIVATGVRDATTALHGDGVWRVPAGGGGPAVASVHTISSSGAALTLDAAAAQGSIKVVTLTANCVFTLTGAVAGQRTAMEVALIQDGTGSRTVTWPGSVQWFGGTPVLLTAAGSVDRFLLTSYNGGSVWYGEPLGRGYSIASMTGLQTALNAKVTSSPTGLTLWKGTQAAYDAIGTKDASTVYAITG